MSIDQIHLIAVKPVENSALLIQVKIVLQKVGFRDWRVYEWDNGTKNWSVTQGIRWATISGAKKYLEEKGWVLLRLRHDGVDLKPGAVNSL